MFSQYSQDGFAHIFVDTFIKVLRYDQEGEEWRINGQVMLNGRKWVCEEGTEERIFSKLEIQELIREFLCNLDPDGYSFGRQGLTLSFVRAVEGFAKGDNRYRKKERE